MGEEIYIFKDYRLARRNNTILLEHNEEKEFIPVTTVKVIHVFGEFDCNKKFLELLSKYHIILYLYNYSGNCIGRFYPNEYRENGNLLLKQCICYQKKEKRVDLAKKFLSGGVQTMLQTLKYYNRRGKELEKEIEKIKSLYDKLQEQSDVEQLMGIEGNIHQIYYKTFNKIIVQDGFLFKQRNKRPPKDNINSLISFLNTLVYNEVLSQIYSTKLNPCIGYLHSSNERKETLCLDIAELFKPVLADRIIFMLLNKRMISKDDFIEETGGILIKDKAKKRIVEEFHKKLQTEIKEASNQKRATYRSLIRTEIIKLQKDLLQEEEYEPIIFKA